MYSENRKHKKIKRNLRSASVILAATLLVCGTTGCAAAQAEPSTVTEPTSSASELMDAQNQTPKYRFSIGYSSEGYTASLTKWAERVNAATDGAVQIDLFGGNVLGSGGQMLESTAAGTLSCVACSTSVSTALVPQAAVFDIPACYEEYIRPYKICDGAFLEKINEYYRQAGLELLNLKTSEYWIISSGRPLSGLEDLKGFRLRTANSYYHNKLYELLGVTCVDDINLDGIAYILDENAVDGVETTYRILKTQDLLDVQPHALGAPFFVMSSMIAMNRESYDALPAEYQQILKQELVASLESNTADANEAEGLDITWLSEAERAQLRTLAAPVLSEIEEAAGPSLMQVMREFMMAE